MVQPREESDREHRIADEVIVDAYDSIERVVTRSETNLAVPLGQLKCDSGDEQTCRAVEDWYYWLARGYAF